MMDNNDQHESDMVCQIEAFTKSFTLKITGCSLITNHFNFKNGMVIAKFDLGGHSWAVNLLPYSCTNIALLSKTTTEMGLEIEFSLLDQKSGGHSFGIGTDAKSHGTINKQGDSVRVTHCLGTWTFTKFFCRKNFCTLKCFVQLLKPMCAETRNKKLLVPASNFVMSDLYQHFIHLWETGEGADVAFKVCQDIITAHRNVLIARSPVFRAQFFSPMIESKTNCIIEVENMKPEVFKLVLHYIYTDNLRLQQEISLEMAQHVLVAADRYGLERLKLICDEKLSDSLTVETAGTTLVLAEQHNCEQLKNRCIDFVASRENLQVVMATDGYRHLMESCPSILNELLGKLDGERRNS